MISYRRITLQKIFFKSKRWGKLLHLKSSLVATIRAVIYPERSKIVVFPPSPNKQCRFYEKNRKQAYQIHFQHYRKGEWGFSNNFSRIFDLPGNFRHGLSIYRKKILKRDTEKENQELKN